MTADQVDGSITNKAAIVKTAVAAARKNPKHAMAIMDYCAKLGHHDADPSAADDDAFVDKLARGESGGDQDSSTAATSAPKPESENDR